MKFMNQQSMRKLMRFSVIPMMVFALSAQAQKTGARPFPADQTGQHSHSDTKFIKHAAADNQQEIQLGQLGEQKAQNQQLKDFSKQLQADHSQALNKLQPIAQNLNVPISAQLPSRQKAEIDRLQKLNGADFDKEFATYLLRDHARDMNIYQREARRTQNADLKGYAQNTSQAMQTHLQSLEAIAKEVGVDQKTVAGIMQRVHGGMGAPATPTGREKGGSTSKDQNNQSGDSGNTYSESSDNPETQK
jgi:putative membrane protein